MLAPISFMVSEGWVSLLEASEAKNASDWLLQLHLGVALTETEFKANGSTDFARARARFSRSMELLPNPIAARCLAVTAPTVQTSWAKPKAFNASWALARKALASDSTPAATGTGSALNVASALAEEITRFLLQNGTGLGGGSGEVLESFLAEIEALGRPAISQRDSSQRESPCGLRPRPCGDGTQRYSRVHGARAPCQLTLRHALGRAGGARPPVDRG